MHFDYQQDRLTGDPEREGESASRIEGEKGREKRTRGLREEENPRRLHRTRVEREEPFLSLLRVFLKGQVHVSGKSKRGTQVQEQGHKCDTREANNLNRI